MRKHIWAMALMICCATSAYAIDYPNVASLPGTTAAVTNTTFGSCSSGNIPDPLCVGQATSLGAIASCPCILTNPIQVIEYTAQIAGDASPATLKAFTSLLAQLSANSNATMLSNFNKSGTSISATKFLAIGASAGEISNRQNAYSNAILSALTQTTALTVKLFIVPRVLSNGIDDVLQITPNGKKIFVHGPLKCPVGQLVRKLWVTATQESTGAVAHAEWTGTCTGDTQIWNVTAHKSGESKSVFTEGPAQLCAVAVFKEGNQSRSSQQWCVEAQLFKQ